METVFILELNIAEFLAFRCLLDDYDDPDLNNLYPGEDWQEFVKSCDGKPLEYLRHKLDSLLHERG